MSCFVYILYSPGRNRFYVGSTCGSIDERIRRHNSNHTGYTGHINDWALVYHEAFSDKHLALAREKEIKGWKSRQRILKLISSVE